MADKTIIVGDVHLGRSLTLGKVNPGSTLNSRIVDQLNILRWILDKAIKEDVENIIFTGDIFQETRPDYQLIILFINWLKECSSQNIKCHIIFGNHDTKRSGKNYTSALDIISTLNDDNIFVYNDISTFETEDVCFTLLPFRDKRSLGCETVSEAIEQIHSSLEKHIDYHTKTKTKVLVGHIAIEGSIYTDEIDDVSNEIMFPIDKLSSFDYVFMGHVHTPQIFKATNYVSHIGSLDLSDFGECNQVKKIALIDATKRFEVSLEDIPSRPLKRFRIEIQKHTDPTKEVMSLLKKSDLTNAVVKIEIKYLDPDSIEVDRDKVSKYIEENAFHLAGLTESRNQVVLQDNDKVIESSEIDPKEAVDIWADKIDHIDDDEKDMFVTLCKDIVNEVLASGKKGH